MRTIPEINDYLKKHYVTDATHDQLSRWLCTFYGPNKWSENELPNKITFETLRDFTHENTEEWNNQISQVENKRKAQLKKLVSYLNPKKLIKTLISTLKKASHFVSRY